MFTVQLGEMFYHSLVNIPVVYLQLSLVLERPFFLSKEYLVQGVAKVGAQFAMVFRSEVVQVLLLVVLNSV